MKSQVAGVGYMLGNKSPNDNRMAVMRSARGGSFSDEVTVYCGGGFTIFGTTRTGARAYKRTLLGRRTIERVSESLFRVGALINWKWKNHESEHIPHLVGNLLANSRGQ